MSYKRLETEKNTFYQFIVKEIKYMLFHRWNLKNMLWEIARVKQRLVFGAMNTQASGYYWLRVIAWENATY